MALCWYADEAVRFDEGADRAARLSWHRVFPHSGEHGRATAKIRAVAPDEPDGHAGDPRKSPASHQLFILPMGVGAQVRAFVTRNIEVVTDSRKCEQCGVLFTPRREHARFCSARCRVAWNRLNASDPPAEGGALGWTITAMRETIDRLLRARGWDRPHAFAVISEAVWWVTMVDATLVRYHPDAYDGVLARHEATERQAIEGTFGGLRFVRNQMGYYLDHADFIQPGRGALAAWTWRSLPEPGLDSLPARGQEWEMTRYREYRAWLASQPVGDTFRLAGAFLRRASETCLAPS